MTEPTAHTVLAAPRPGRSWPALAVLTAATFWTVTAEMLPSGLLPSMRRDFEVSEGAIGALVSAWAMTIAIVSVPLVRLTIRVPRTVLLTVSLALTAAANFLTALAPDYTIALIARVLAATAHGLFWALVVSYVATVVDPARLGKALSIVLAGPALAGFAGLPAAALIAEPAGWRAVTAGLALILALTAAALWLILPHRVRAHETADTTETAGVWDRTAHSVVHVACGGGLVLVGHFAVFTYITTLVTGLAALDASAIPAVLLTFGVTSGLGIVVSGFAADRFPRASLIVAAALVAAGLGLFLLSDHRPVFFVVGIAIWGFAMGAFPPIFQARVLRLSSSAFRPLAGSIVVTVLNLGVAAGATLGGITLGQGDDVLILSALLAATAGTLALALHRRTTAAGTPTES